MTVETTLQDWQLRATQMRADFRPWIDGRRADSRGDIAIDVVNPGTATKIGALPEGHASDIDDAVAAARRGIDRGWPLLPPHARKAMLLELARLIRRDREQLALFDCVEVGKPIAAALGEVEIAAGFFQYYAEAIDKLYGAVAPSDSRCLAVSWFEPRGVVGCIVPWNFPLINASLKAAPALAAGNAVILKPSELSSLSALHLAQLAQEAGLPPGILNVVPGAGQVVGTALAAHPQVDFLSFTGSTATGRRVMVAAANSNGKPVMLECGGKSPQVVFADCEDLDAVADAVVQDILWNQGQVCVARSRLIVEQPVHAALLDRIGARFDAVMPGDPLDPATGFGPLASKAQFDRVRDYIQAGQGEGARLRPVASLAGQPGYFVRPHLFEHALPSMRIAQEEIFGPVLIAHSFTGVAQAMELANDSKYGLAASVWTRDVNVAHHAARTIKAGHVKIHATAQPSFGSGFALPVMPYRQSGFGSEFGMDGLKSYLLSKAVQYMAAV